MGKRRLEVIEKGAYRGRPSGGGKLFRFRHRSCRNLGCFRLLRSVYQKCGSNPPLQVHRWKGHKKKTGGGSGTHNWETFRWGRGRKIERPERAAGAGVKR